MGNKYSDIIKLPHKQSATRPHMPVYNRAAQFAPFAALVGYDEAVRETARFTDSRGILTDSSIEVLNSKLQFMQDHIDSQYEYTITFFQNDLKKSGGAYVSRTGAIKKIDEYKHTVILQSKEEIFIDDIVSIESQYFR